MKQTSKISVFTGCFLLLTCLVFGQVNPTWDTLYHYKSATSGVPHFVNPALVGSSISKSSYGWINSTPCITGFSGFGISPAQTSYNALTNPYVEFTIEPAHPSYSFLVDKFTVQLRSSSIGANFVMMAYSLNDGTTWISKGLPDSPNISATCGITSSKTWSLSSSVFVGGASMSQRLKVRLFYFHSLGFIGGNNQVLNFVVHGKMNFPVDYYSIASGNVSDAIWSPSPNGTIGQRVYFTPEINAFIQGGHEVIADTRETAFHNLTVQSGGRLKSSTTDPINLNYISIFGNLIVNGLIGNSLTYNAIGIQIEGPNVTISGTGAIHPGRIRKQYSIHTESNLLIQSSITLHYPGAAMYNNAANSNFHVDIPAGSTLRVVGSGAIPGSVSIDGPSESDIVQKGGSINVAGSLVVNGQLSIASSNNNSLFPCLLNIQPGGNINVNDLVVRNNGVNQTSLFPGAFITVSGIMKHLEGLLNTQDGIKFLNGACLLHGASTPGIVPYVGGQLTGNIKFATQGSEAIGVYNYWSSPVLNSPLSAINSNGNSTGSLLNTYHYDASLATSTTIQGLRQGWVHLDATDLMENGKGYITTTGGSVLFNGNANDGTILIEPIEGQFTRFNLIGNPYPGPISANQFLQENQSNSIYPALYFWDDDASLGQDYSVSDYIVSNAVGTVATGGNSSAAQFEGRIAAGQGFFVEAKESAQSIRFSNSMRTSGATSFFEESVFAKYWIRLSGESAASETLIAFGDDATDGIDEQFDAKMFSANSVVSLGSVIESTTFSIQARPNTINDSYVFLGVSCFEEGDFTFQLSNAQNEDPTVLVFLYDHLENQEVCLSNQNYTVHLGENEISNNRFELRFSSPLVATVEDVTCEGENGLIGLYCDEEGWQFDIQGTNGCCPITGLIQDSISISLPEGNYLLKLTHPLSGKILEYFPNIGASHLVDVQLNCSSDTIFSGESIMLHLTSSQNLSVSWYLDDILVSNEVLLENLIIEHAGIHLIRVEISNGACETSFMKEVLVLDSASLGLNKTSNSGLKVFPNPVNTQLNLILPHQFVSGGGKVVLRNLATLTTYEFNYSESQFTIDTSDIPEGVYLIQVFGLEDEKSFIKCVSILH